MPINVFSVYPFWPSCILIINSKSTLPAKSISSSPLTVITNVLFCIWFTHLARSHSHLSSVQNALVPPFLVGVRIGLHLSCVLKRRSQWLVVNKDSSKRSIIHGTRGHEWQICIRSILTICYYTCVSALLICFSMNTDVTLLWRIFRSFNPSHICSTPGLWDFKLG